MLHKKELCILILGTLVFAVFGCRGGVEEEVESGKKYKMVTEKGLLSVSTPDKDNIWMVGYNGTIIHSDDGGKTWQQQISPLEIDLFDVFFTDDKNGWIVAKYGNASILLTIHSAGLWEARESSSTQRTAVRHGIASIMKE
jgi:photosystem II stability/assembly factor-like uncharacterized protein